MRHWLITELHYFYNSVLKFDYKYKYKKKMVDHLAMLLLSTTETLAWGIRLEILVQRLSE